MFRDKFVNQQSELTALTPGVPRPSLRTIIKTALIRKAISLDLESEDPRYCVCARDEIINADGETLTVTAADIFG